MKRWLVAAVAAGAMVPGCVCGPAGVDALRFACDAPADCAPGYACVAGECSALRPSGIDGGDCDAVPEVCDDGVDDDCDGFIDCGDADCVDASCGAAGQVCGSASCVCSGNGGEAQSPELSCADGADNDCSGLFDCEDPVCSGVACGPSGRACVGGECACSGNGGASEPVESDCTDGADNDCDGLRDCADPDCDAASCDFTGLLCRMGACRCPLDAGVAFPPEDACDDGRDDDCDGFVDCDDPDCDTRGCGPAARACVGSVCTCHADGSAPFAEEQDCADGTDEDCDGLTDCEDPGCAGQACGPHGSACAAAGCLCGGNGGTAEVVEATCSDGADNDCDGLADCDDADCAEAACGPGKRCSAGVCLCQLDGGTREVVEQSCDDGLDNDCDGLADCAPGQACSGTPGICHY